MKPMRIRNTGFKELRTSQSVNPQRRAEHCFPRRRQSTGRLGSSPSCQPSTCTRAPPAPGTLPQILTAPKNIKKTASYLFTNKERKPSYHDQPSIEMKCENFSNVIRSRFLLVRGPILNNIRNADLRVSYSQRVILRLCKKSTLPTERENFSVYISALRIRIRCFFDPSIRDRTNNSGSGIRDKHPR